jgi:hypothetical protein
VSIEKYFSRKVTSGQIIEKKNLPPILFYGKNLALFVFMFETQPFSMSQYFKDKDT